MGIFSSKKTIIVSSTLYNMAGDEDDRPDYLKGSLFAGVMSDADSLGMSVVDAHFTGPGMKQRQFFRYADRNDISGMTETTIVNNVRVDVATVAGEIDIPATPVGLSIFPYSAEVTNGEFDFWIERWILENHPTRVIEDWLGDYDPVTNSFSVEFPNNDFFTWVNDIAPVYNFTKRYIVCKYILTLPTSEASVVMGTSSTGVTLLPDLTGFTNISDTATFTNTTLVRTRTTTWTYSNGDPAVVTEDAVPANSSGDLNTAEEVWEREVSVQRNGLSVQGERQIWNITGTDFVDNTFSETVVTTTDMGGGVTRTETSVTSGEGITTQWTTRYDTQDIFTSLTYETEKVFIYELDTGNLVLDALVSEADASGMQEFFPFMPLRINNVSIAEPAYDTLHAEMSRAYKRAYGYKKSIDSLLDSIEDNPSIDDIDYAYLVWGCSLNVKEHACRRYIFKFFEKMIPFQNAGSSTAMAEFQIKLDEYETALSSLEAWEASVFADQEWGTIPPRPTIPKLSPPSNNTIRLADGALGFDYRMNWIHVNIQQFTGTFDLDDDLAGMQTSKRDDIKIVDATGVSWQERLINEASPETVQYIDKNIPSVYIYWQVADNTYRRMEIWGLVSQNFIYKGKSVNITSSQALADVEESGFLVPLHYPTFLEMGIIDYTQMATANAHILFNSYEIVKQKWYSSFLFKILIIVVVLIAAVIFFPSAFAAGGGLLGTNIAVGTALGLTGTAALVAGVVANYIASIIIAEILKIVGTELLGEKWGAVFAAVAGFALGSAVSGTPLFSAKGILGLSNALANGYAGWVQGDIAEMQEKIEQEGDQYEERMDKIQELIDGLARGNGLNFNPIFLTDSVRGNGRGSSGGYLPETADQFIRRTTMTGADVVELTHAMVYDFVDVQQTLPRN